MDSAADAFRRLISDSKYIALTTFRQSGDGVTTTVWIARDGERAVFLSQAPGKVKRIRANQAVQVAPSDPRGSVIGEFIPARAELLEAAAARGARDVYIRRNGLMARIALGALKLLRRDVTWLELRAA